MNSALDAMVEDLVRFWRSFQVDRIVEAVIEKGTAAAAEAARKLAQRERDAVHGAVRAEIEKLVPKSLIPKAPRCARCEKSLADAPSLNYRGGQFIRLSRSDYRTYSAAVRCYASEIGFRGIRSWPEVTDEKDGRT